MRRQAETRRARNALVWGLLGYAALQLGAVLVMEGWRPELRDPQFVHKVDRLRRRRAEATPGRRPCLVCVLGTSRTMTGLRGGVVESEMERRLGRPVILYNLGIPGDSPMNQLLNLERLLAGGIRPDAVVVEVFPFYLRENAAESLGALPSERLGLWDLAMLIRHRMPVRELKRWNWLCLAAPWYAHRVEVLTALAPQVLHSSMRQDYFRDCDGSGFIVRVFCSDPQSRARALKSARDWYATQLKPFRIGGPFCPAMRRLLDRCDQEGIPAALLMMPEGPVFRDFYPPDAWPQVEAFMQELARPHATPIINARDWFGEDDFLDSHHLLVEPAATFTRRLAREGLLPLLRKTQPPTTTPHPSPRLQARRTGG